jgi:hypothetical protein
MQAFFYIRVFGKLGESPFSANKQRIENDKSKKSRNLSKNILLSYCFYLCASAAKLIFVP